MVAKVRGGGGSKKGRGREDRGVNEGDRESE